jgi:ribosome-associated protein
VPPKKKPALSARPAPPAPATVEVEATSDAWLTCVRAMESRKASAIRVLDLRPLTSFADYFVLCSGANPRQIQAICDEVLKQMKARGERPISLEGYDNAEWILADFGDLLVHIFSEKSREYYDLDRLWRDAPKLDIPPE